MDDKVKVVFAQEDILKFQRRAERAAKQSTMYRKFLKDKRILKMSLALLKAHHLTHLIGNSNGTHS